MLTLHVENADHRNNVVEYIIRKLAVKLTVLTLS